MNTITRTFDCPWCGAINPVPSDHLGEHFTCPECRKSTKVTEKNTSAGELTDAPADAPHLSGARTFDCPWCGAISAVPPGHLGERFACPECHKDTKLTSTNTQRAPVTAPPPDAPHVEPSSRGFWIGVAVVAVAGLAWFFLRGTEEPGSPGTGTTGAAHKEAAPAVPSTPGAKPPGESPRTPPPAPAPEAPVPGMTGGAPPMPTPGMTEAPPPMPAPGMTESPPAPPSESPERIRARAQRDAAVAALAAATQKHERAAAAIEAWSRDNPAFAEAAKALPGLQETSTELSRLLTDPSVVADPANPRPAEMRAVRAAMAKFVEASPARVAAAERALASMRQDLGGREVAGVADWREIPFAGEGFRRALGRHLEAARTVSVPADLAAALVSTLKEVDAARAALDSAQAQWKALEAPPK